MLLQNIHEGILTAHLEGDIIIVEAKIVSKALAIASKHPIMTGLAALWVNSAIQKYKQNKRYTTRFFAKTHEERTLYKKIVDDLMRTGHYKIVKSQYVDGGHMWELRRRSS